MLNANNYSRALVGICLLLLQATNSLCEDLSSSVVQIYSDHKYICAGTLVKDNFVVTLAACFKEHRDRRLLYVASNDLLLDIDISAVAEIFIPPNYKSRHMDVAVLRINSFRGANIKPAKLCTKRSIEHDEAVTLYYWDSPEIVSNFGDNRSLKNATLIVSDYKTFPDTVFYAADPAKMLCFNDKASPAAIGGEFCGIYKQNRYCNNNDEPASFTSLANPQIMAFIENSIEDF